MSYRYDEFLWQLAQEPLQVNEALAVDDGAARCTGRYFEVIRTVMRLEYLGYQYKPRFRIPRPYVREVFSCGHSHETTAGEYVWQKPRKTAVCFECSNAMPPDGKADL